MRCLTTADGLPSNDVLNVSTNAHGSVTVETAAGAAAFDGKRFQSAAAAEHAITGLSGHIWRAGAAGVTESVGTYSKTYTLADGLPSPRVTAIFPDREGDVWIGTEAGLVRIYQGRVERFAPSEALSADTILSITEDREGDLWIGTDTDGVTVLRDQKFASYANRSELDAAVRCVLAAGRTVWFGTDGSGVAVLSSGTLKSAPFNPQLSSQVVLSLATAQNGDLLVGTPDGLNRVHNGSVVIVTSSDGLPDDFVRSLYADGDGSIWIGTRHGLAHWAAGSRITSFTQANGLGSDIVGSILRDRSGDLWVGTLHGLSRMRRDGFVTFTTANGLSNDIITGLSLDREGRLWAGTQGGGCNRVLDGKFLPVTPQMGAPATVYGLVEDPGGAFWMASETGIYRTSKDELLRASSTKSAIDVRAYGTGDGLRVRECSGGGHPVIAQDAGGDLWFAMARGAAQLKASHLPDRPLEAPVVLESFSVDGGACNLHTAVRVGPGHEQFAFEYAALSFHSPQRVQYRYRLDKFDRAWVNAGSRRVAYYTNLPPGSFRFIAEARNADGAWISSASSFGFVVEPRFFQTWWFRTLLLMLAAAAGYAVYYMRVRQVQARYDAVLSERNRIAREIHDTLAQGFIGVSVQLELVARLLISSADAAREQLDQTRTLVRQSIADARQSIWELRSQSADTNDFAARLSKMARQVTASSQMKVQLEVHGQYRALAPVIEAELARIAQEAITNAVRHSGALNAKIELTYSAKKLRMIVSDDGCGFALAANGDGPAGHYGLRGMRERAQQIHAEFSVQSAPSNGTSVAVEAPAK